MSGPHSKPCTRTSFPQLFPATTGTSELLTSVTPGSVRSSCSTRSSTAMLRTES